MKYLDNEAMVHMVQTSQVRWKIQTREGHTLKDDITISNANEAEEYVKGYLSSFQCWTYVVVPLLPKGKSK